MQKTCRSGAPAVARRIAVPTALLIAAGSVTAAHGEGIPKMEWELSNGAKFRIYGQIDTGILVYDDGFQTEIYAPVDNANSSSRIGATYQDSVNEWDLEARLEVQYPVYATSNLNVDMRSPDWTWVNTNFRKIEITFTNETFGKLWLGQGSMASDGSAEVDLSGTAVIAYASISDTAGGQLFRYSDNGAFGPAVKSAFSDYDGLGRKVRIRYDTPKVAGFGLGVSYGEDLLAENDTPLADIALTYANTFDSLQVQAAVAYAWQENDIEILDGSASILHVPTGLNLTIAAGSRDNGTQIGSYVYGKAGLIHKFWDCGPTAFSVDYYRGEDIAAAGSTSQSFSIAAVQNITDYNTELYLTYRRYEYDEIAADFDDGDAVLGGVRLKF